MFATTEEVLAVFPARGFCYTSLPLVLGWTLTFVFQFDFNRVILSRCSRISFLLAQGMRGKFCAGR